MINGEKHKDLMISISTGNIKDEEAIGLAMNHAYAVLEIIEIDGKWFMLVLNPWWRFTYKGWFSVDDTSNWTPELKKKLGFEKL